MPTETDFVPTGIDCTNWSEIEPLVESLTSREIDSTEALEQWLLEWSDVQSYVHDRYSRLHVDMTCHTDNEGMQAAYKAFNETVMPHVKKSSFAMDRKYYDSEHRSGLDERRYAVYDRDTATDIELFREENVAIETEISMLGQEQRKITGAQLVDFDGQERTMPEMTKYMEEPDRAVRESAWRAVEDRRLEDNEAIRGIFDQMLAKRHQIALNAGFKNYRDYIFPQKHRFDYTVADCEAFHDSIEKCIVPLLREMNRERGEAMFVDTYRPWDMSVDVKGRPPLDPFDGEVDRMVEGGQKIFDAMDVGLGEQFRALCDGTSLDLDTRRGKAPGGYQTTFALERRPFIFMNAAGLGRDLRVLLHEAGHAFHTQLGGNDPLIAYRHAPIEFCEVASMTMELTSLPFLDQVYESKEEADRARRVQLEGVVRIFPWIAQIDAWQHWLYTHPGHSHEAREEAWLALEDRFGGGADWSGLEMYKAERWQRQLHLFHYPFYYVEYGIAQLGALQVWLNYRTDPAGAIQSYKKALSLGGSRPLPELFEAAGATWGFGSDTIGAVVEAVKSELEVLPL